MASCGPVTIRATTPYVAANRAVTIVDTAGVVRYHWVAESLGVEPDYAEIHATVATLASSPTVAAATDGISAS